MGEILFREQKFDQPYHQKIKVEEDDDEEDEDDEDWEDYK